MNILSFFRMFAFKCKNMSGEVSLRRHRIGDEGRFSVSGLIEKLKTEITGKS